jgi:FMN-dependent oxidoreductase (nitrilotriacetate monooxygenase family)
VFDAAYYQNIARISERGALDAIFLADGPALGGDVGHQPAGRLEPTVLLTAVALATTHIGVIATCSSSYNSPFNLARRLQSLDHISGGRAAWNVVTNAGDAAAQNFGLGGAPVHADRYARADEFVDVVKQLWDSWEDGAIIGDAAQGRFADPARVHSIDHQGAHFQVKGPLNVPRSPQGRPVIVQAGSSEGGKALGSRHADAIFTTQTTLDDGIAFYTEMKARAGLGPRSRSPQDHAGHFHGDRQHRGRGHCPLRRARCLSGRRRPACPNRATHRHRRKRTRSRWPAAVRPAGHGGRLRTGQPRLLGSAGQPRPP